MKADDQKNLREFLEDPARIPADLPASFSEAEARDVRRHQQLDRNLRKAFGELGSALEKKAPPLSDKEFKARLLGAINAGKNTPPVTELAYVRKVRLRQMVSFAAERPAYGIGAVAALFLLAFLPFFFQNQAPDQSLAQNDAGATEDRLGGAAQAEVADQAPLAGTSGARPARPLKQPAPTPVKKTQPELARADKVPAAEAARPAEQPAAKPAEEVAINIEAPSFRSRSAIVPESAEQDQAAAGKPAAPAPAVDAQFKVRERILTQKVQMARDKTAKVKALRDLEAFYRQQGQTARAQDVQRQIQQLQ